MLQTYTRLLAQAISPPQDVVITFHLTHHPPTPHPPPGDGVREVKIHRILLSEMDGPLSTLVSGGFKEAEQTSITLHECFESFDVIRKYLYCEPIHMDQVPEDLPLVADRWGLTTLFEACFTHAEERAHTHKGIPRMPASQLVIRYLPVLATVDVPARFKSYIALRIGVELTDIDQYFEENPIRDIGLGDVCCVDHDQDTLCRRRRKGICAGEHETPCVTVDNATAKPNPDPDASPEQTSSSTTPAAANDKKPEQSADAQGAEQSTVNQNGHSSKEPEPQETSVETKTAADLTSKDEATAETAGTQTDSTDEVTGDTRDQKNAPVEEKTPDSVRSAAPAAVASDEKPVPVEDDIAPKNVNSEEKGTDADADKPGKPKEEDASPKPSEPPVGNDVGDAIEPQGGPSQTSTKPAPDAAGAETTDQAAEGAEADQSVGETSNPPADEPTATSASESAPAEQDANSDSSSIVAPDLDMSSDSGGYDSGVPANASSGDDSDNHSKLSKEECVTTIKIDKEKMMEIYNSPTPQRQDWHEKYNIWEVFYSRNMLRQVIHYVSHYGPGDHTPLLLDVILRQMEKQLSDDEIVTFLREIDWDWENPSCRILQMRGCESWSMRAWRLLSCAHIAFNGNGTDLRMSWNYTNLFSDMQSRAHELANRTTNESDSDSSQSAADDETEFAEEWNHTVKDDEFEFTMALQCDCMVMEHLAALFLRIQLVEDDNNPIEKTTGRREVVAKIKVVESGCGCGLDKLTQGKRLGFSAHPTKVSDERMDLWSYRQKGYSFRVMSADELKSWIDRHSPQCGLVFQVRLYVFPLADENEDEEEKASVAVGCTCGYCECDDCEDVKEENS